MKTIFKRDSKDNIRYLYISVIDDELIQESGIINTDSPIIHRKKCKGKNIGKSNETSPHQQAVSEANSLIVSKYSEGYFETKEEAENELVILPMLAKSYEDEKHKIDWNNCFIQPKLDGQRCLIIIKNGTIKLISRDGKLITTMQHIINDLEYVWKDVTKDIIYDGELYVHGLSFQENMKLIKKVSKETSKVKFHCYDVINNEPFLTRHIEYLTTSKTIENS